jgi:hypothetical protein
MCTGVPPPTSFEWTYTITRPRCATPFSVCISWNQGACTYPGRCSYRHVCATCQPPIVPRHQKVPCINHAGVGTKQNLLWLRQVIGDELYLVDAPSSDSWLATPLLIVCPYPGHYCLKPQGLKGLGSCNKWNRGCIAKFCLAWDPSRCRSSTPLGHGYARVWKRESWPIHKIVIQPSLALPGLQHLGSTTSLSCANILNGWYHYINDLLQLTAVSSLSTAQWPQYHTPVEVEKLLPFLACHLDQQFASYIYDGLIQGFRIGFNLTPLHWSHVRGTTLLAL